eukprot:1536888-Rhodomonas_salina.2
MECSTFPPTCGSPLHAPSGSLDTDAGSLGCGQSAARSCPADCSKGVSPDAPSAPPLQACPHPGPTVCNSVAPVSGLCSRGLGPTPPGVATAS